MSTEQGILRISIVVTFILAALGAVIGLIAGSSAIVFDGVYGLIDAVMTVLALMVARVIAASNAADAAGRAYSQRFTMGFWHLEPIVLGVNGMLLTGAALYAMLDAVGILLRGGHSPAFGPALLYTGISVVIDLGMALFVRRANRSIGSDFVALDARGWAMTAALSGSLFASFLIAYAVKSTSLAWIGPYVDPVALLVICIVIFPMPIATIRKALSQILLITPDDLRRQVEDVGDRVAAEQGFLSHRAYVARVGRGIQIEMNFVVPRNGPARRLEEWDALRDEIGLALGNDGPNLWLTIVFTTDVEWA
ncbi:MAG: cation transporter [Sphingomonas paucimobilis]